MNNSDKVVVVTGASGYIGAHIVKQLLEKGYKVRACVRDPNSERVQFLKEFATSDALSLVKADLLEADFNAIFDGCYAVIHTATPYIHTTADPENDLLKPAVQGTLSVLEAASKTTSIRRVVVTSSGGAIIDSSSPTGVEKEEYSESDWNTVSSLTLNPYFYSKVQAEKAAWQFHEENKNNSTGNQFELSVINPGFTIGPALSPILNTSQNLVIRLITQAQMPFPTMVGMADVRDVAKAHVLSMESDKSNNQRYWICQRTVSWPEFPKIFQDQCPNYKFNINLNPPQVNKVWRLDNSKVKDQLGLEFISIEQSAKDMVDHLVCNKLISL
ncbi:hypothetical protein CYY_002003 [Polysphondylium violaceum]|uniref:NAD-dependent epimerase/dehydratase domain-containing protein n=1 Tax=Polysphondylium violaceum TaxID=133409 RepID=A0A8J4PZZ9_9MYCE|nr:hypothetical protein CYY_002003 [Polysphondylium violaceum]